MLKVLQCLNHYLPEHIAGTEVYVASLVRELQKLRVESKIIIPGYNNPETEQYMFDGTEVIRYAEPSAADRETMMGERPPEGLREFISILAAEKPDIVHFHELAGSNGVSLFHVRAAKEAGFKSLVTFHIAKYSCRTGTLMYKNKVPCDGVIRRLRCSKCRLNDMGEHGVKAAIIEAAFTITDVLHFNSLTWKNSLGTALAFPRLIQKLKEDLYSLEKNTDAFVVLTNWYRDVLLRNKINADHIYFLPQALPDHSATTQKKETPYEAVKLIFIGRISHFKGVLLLIEALQNIPQEKIALDIYGESTDDDYFQQCLNAAKGMHNITWKGRLSPKLVVETISNYDVLCLPSAVCEMAPLVIQEAFAAEVPVLASDVYGNAEQIKENVNGWLFRFRDKKHLGERLQMLIDDRAIIETAKPDNSIVRNFAHVAHEQKNVYEKILVRL